ncbi:MAG: hypothetical protein ACOY42_02140 [Pseudomonadota bacterium]
MRIKCPACGIQFGIEVALQEDAGRELLGELARLSAPLGRALVAYLGLFRPAERVLSWGRALQLARAALALGPEHVLLPALDDTLAALADKRGQPGWQPLKNHNYLKRVCDSVAASQVARAELPAAAPAGGRASRHRQALTALDD